MTQKEPCKEPVFLFTSSSMRQAAWAGWYSAQGDKENAEKFCHAAYAEWAKEISAGRRFAFAEKYSNDIYHLDPETLKRLTDKYLKDIGAEVKKKKKKKTR